MPAAWQTWFVPDLSSMCLAADDSGLLAFPSRGGEPVWRRAGTSWVPAGVFDGAGRVVGVYRDASRALVTVSWDGKALVRRVWGGAEAGRTHLDLSDRSVGSLAFDPLRRRLVVSGGLHGVNPWTVSISEEGVVTQLPVLGSVVFDERQQRLFATVDAQVDPGHSVQSVEPVFGWLDGDAFRPLQQLEGRFWSKLAYDRSRGTTLGFLQTQQGAPAHLQVVEGDQLTLATPVIESPPLNLFELVDDAGVLTAFGGQRFEGSEASLWRLAEGAFRETPVGTWPPVDGKRVIVSAGPSLVHLSKRSLHAVRREGEAWRPWGTAPVLETPFDAKWSQAPLIIGGLGLGLIDATGQLWDWPAGGAPSPRIGVRFEEVSHRSLGIVGPNGVVVLVPDAYAERGFILDGGATRTFETAPLCALTTTREAVLALDAEFGLHRLGASGFESRAQLSGGAGRPIALATDRRSGVCWVLTRDGRSSHLFRLDAGSDELLPCEAPAMPVTHTGVEGIAVDETNDALTWWSAESFATCRVAT